MDRINLLTTMDVTKLAQLVHHMDLIPDQWIDYAGHGFRQYPLWKNRDTGASIALLEFQKGGGFPVRHSHASNQFMYCIEGEYEYTNSQLRLKAGSFYINAKDHPHGPTIAHERTVLIEMYDGPNSYETPVFHDDELMAEFIAYR
jgi:anti-sigma factor ChrR (cupin superfamily)